MTDLLERTGAPHGDATAARAREGERAPRRSDGYSGRLLSLDVLRGVTILGMIIVNAQGSGDHAFWGTSHANWNGWTPADLVFPSFLFIVGASMAFSLARYLDPAAHGVKPTRPYARISRRTATLFALGLVLTGLGRVPLAELHLMGVLQRIALCYLLASLAVLHLKHRTQLIVCAVVLVGYWLALTHVAVPGHGAGVLTPSGNAAGAIDRSVLGQSHLYADGPYDPEGLLGTLPATVTVLIGYWSAQWLRRRPKNAATSKRLALTGASLFAAGELSQFVLPINKRLWTSSFVLLTAGVSLVALAAAFELVDVRGHRRLGAPFMVFGLNAIVVFVASELLQGWLTSSGLRAAIYDRAFASWLGFRVGSLAYSLAFAALCWQAMLVLYRRRIFLKV
jgi:predicted acyltransferase